MEEKAGAFQRAGMHIDARLAAVAKTAVGRLLIRLAKTIYVAGSYLAALAVIGVIGGVAAVVLAILLKLVGVIDHYDPWWFWGGAILFVVSSGVGVSWHWLRDWRTDRRYEREVAEHRRVSVQ